MHWPLRTGGALFPQHLGPGPENRETLRPERAEQQSDAECGAEGEMPGIVVAAAEQAPHSGEDQAQQAGIEQVGHEIKRSQPGPGGGEEFDIAQTQAVFFAQPEIAVMQSETHEQANGGADEEAAKIVGRRHAVEQRQGAPEQTGGYEQPVHFVGDDPMLEVGNDEQDDGADQQNEEQAIQGRSGQQHGAENGEGGGQLDGGVARGDLGAAMGASAAPGQPGGDGEKIQEAQAVTAGGAAAGRGDHAFVARQAPAGQGEEAAEAAAREEGGDPPDPAGAFGKLRPIVHACIGKRARTPSQAFQLCV